MRNIFDQYKTEENRLTHALACCLQEDRRLLRTFVKRFDGKGAPVRQSLTVVEQTLPGEEQPSEEEATQRGLPDLWIHDDDRWSLIIENKVQSPVNADQIRRHCKMANRRGFTNHTILVISPEVPPQTALAGANHMKWSEVYTWLLKQQATSEWAQRLTSYMEYVEIRMTADGYLQKSSLTTFSGINFTSDNPWNYREAKRLLRQAMTELRNFKELRRLGMDPKGEGRPAITGREGSNVWDFIPLKHAHGAQNFTAYPHLTMGIQSRRVVVIMTIPNGIKTAFRRNLLRLGLDGFENLVLEICANLASLLRKAKGAKPWAEVVQRHYPSQRAMPIEDGRIEFDLRTAIARKAKGPKPAVRPQPQWLRATFDAINQKRSNLQLGVGATFPLDCPVLHSREALNYIAGTWLSCKPLLKVLLGGN